ncbi:MerR family transcriptional regulator [Reinekea sp. G2M2-21]|uniref:MerR family transcriptional regulator n=1 Tax=Reinekea sp. G2M2-21 TaxID=2788942 RepID=UPI0018AC551C|nr:MerR family transcriptional regulator [Reinekea sp. G2M2-21]
MRKYSIGDVARIAGVSIKTLHHYDRIELLVPTNRSAAGYRFYNDADLDRLHSILLYRALGFSLRHIGQLLASDPKNKMSLLRAQKTQVEQHIERLTAVRLQLEQSLEEEEQIMSHNKFEALNGFDPDQYEDEVQSRWGDTEAYRISAKRTKQYTKEDWSRFAQQQQGTNEQMIAVMEAGLDANSPEAIAAAEKMRLLIDTWFYPCSHEMHAQLGLMYVQDERFRQNYEQQRTGLAEFIQRATQANADQY